MNFQEGEILLIDKPLNWTSFDVVNKLRWNIKKKLGVKKIKVGHAGTLDPLATGLLIICTGKKTKIIESIQAEEKTYTGTILLGQTTPSYDLETEYNQTFPVEHITQENLEAVRLSFLGEQEQIPPIFSAKQIDGKRSYDLARSGKEITLKAAKISITEFKINSDRFPEIDFEIVCSKGTYIRSIAHNFGQKLGSGATLITLRRTNSGNFSVENALSIEACIQKINETD